jgi:hypothetical protein
MPFKTGSTFSGIKDIREVYDHMNASYIYLLIFKKIVYTQALLV